MTRLTLPTNLSLLAAALLCPALAARPAHADPPADLQSALETLRAVQPKGQGHRGAMQAWKTISQADADQLPMILAGMQGANRLADNWFRAAVETIAQRHQQAGGKLPVAALEKFLADTTQAPRARRLAYELIAGVDQTAETRLITPLINDPSLELRRDAIALGLKSAEAELKDGDPDSVAGQFQRLFAASRDLDQVKAVAEKLRDLDQPVDLPKHMGFVLRWHLAGPFNNADGVGFDQAYPPEDGVDLEATYQGKVGDVRWQEYTTADDFGIVDLNEAFNRPKADKGSGYQLTTEHKGAVAYGYTVFDSPEAQPAEFRIGCINANKVWLNGRLLTANEVYHSGMEVDQYVATGRLKKGRNEILVKVAQNEQEESWAQRWQFQLRVCDHLGTALLSQGRTARRPSATDLR